MKRKPAKCMQCHDKPRTVEFGSYCSKACDDKATYDAQMFMASRIESSKNFVFEKRGNTKI